MSEELSWIIHQQHRKTEMERKLREVRDRENALLNQHMQMNKPAPNMKDAYAQVRAKNYKPTQSEIEFRRFTPGTWEDNEKGK